MAKRPVGDLVIIGSPVRTFADEWGVRDTVLAPSEVRTVRNAADTLGVRLGTTPTGRHVSLLLHHVMNVALNNYTAARNHRDRARWQAVYFKARRALGSNRGDPIRYH